MWRNKYFLTFCILCIISIASFVIVKTGNANNLQNEDYTVVTSFYPMYIAALNITDGIEGVEVKNLTNNSTGCVHDYQLSTKDLKMLDSADILVVNGGGMENFLLEVFEQHKDLKVVTATNGLSLLKEDSDIEEAVHEESEHKHDSEFNAHAWLDISLYIKEVENITQAFMENDPQHSTQYKANFDNYKKKLQDLLDYAADINLYQLTRGYNSKDTGVVILHEGFEYFEDTCAFTIEKVIDMDENTVLSAAQIGEIVDMANEGKIKYILADEAYGKAAAEAVNKECNAEVLYLNPLTTGENDKESYVNGMRRNLEILKEAFVND